MGCAFRTWMLLVLVTVIWTTTTGKHYLNQFAVYIKGGREEAERIARQTGYTNLGQIGSLENYYLFVHHGIAKRSLSAARHHHNLLEQQPGISWIEQQVARKRVKRDYVSTGGATWRPNWKDPSWQKMWYLRGGAAGQYDMNLVGAWSKGYTGRGVVVTILDDGIERTHSDLQQNYDPLASDDINGDDDDPMPRYDSTDENRHGTRCAGEVAAVANNSACGVGIAYHAHIGGVRMLDGDVSDAVEARALSLRPQHVDIYSASWGPDDNGRVVDGPAPLAHEAFVRGVQQGRGGLGSIFVWASGNGGSHSDSCSCDGYASSIYTLSVSSTSQRGRKPWYLEECSSTLASTYSSGESYSDMKIITTDLHDRCTDGHTGTSASAPIAAALCALALEANKELSWRDMQYIVLMSARTEPLEDGQWVTNGIGRQVSHRYGYGLMDAAAMVDLAERWTPVPAQHVCTSERLLLNAEIGKGAAGYQLTTDGCQSSPATAVRHLEHVQARVTLSVERRGDLRLHLVSPSGTRCTLLPTRKNDGDADRFDGWPFMSVFFWGEDPRGFWKLVVENAPQSTNYGVLESWQLVMYGTATPPVNVRPLAGQNGTTSASAGSGDGDAVSPTDTAGRCHTQCVPHKGCTGGDAADCIECRHVWVGDVGVCADACPASHYHDVDGATCWPCTAPCRTCKGSSAREDCLSCREDFYLLEDEGTCVSDCAHGYFTGGVEGWCRPCAEGCLWCEGASDHCLSCQPEYQLRRHRCLLHCAADSFRNLHGSCERCHMTCGTCVGETAEDCVLCPAGRVHQAGACLDVCSSGFHETIMNGGMPHCESCHQTCVECSGPLPHHCESCRETSHQLVDGECRQICPLSSIYALGDSVCQPCHDSCVSCHGPGSRHCLSCAPDRVLDGGECVTRCSDTLYVMTAARRGDGHVGVVRVCQPCHASCLTCHGRLSTDCSYCMLGRYLDDGECRTECREGKYELAGMCRACPGRGCRSCLAGGGGGGDDVVCVACRPPYVLLRSRCVAEDACPVGWYAHAGRCARCHVSCSTCRGGGAENCLRCHAAYISKAHMCVKNASAAAVGPCSQGEFWHDQVCAPCHTHCATCVGASPASCLSCQPPYQLAADTGHCLPCCSEGNARDCCHCHPVTGRCRDEVFWRQPAGGATGPSSSAATATASSRLWPRLAVFLALWLLATPLRPLLH